MERQGRLGDLFTIESFRKEENTFLYEVMLNPSHDVYRGHFPGMPVLPGVCMLFIIKTCIARMLHTTVKYTTIRNCKFISVIDPIQTQKLQVRLQLSPDNKLEAMLLKEEITVLKLKAEIQTL